MKGNKLKALALSCPNAQNVSSLIRAYHFCFVYLSSEDAPSCAPKDWSGSDGQIVIVQSRKKCRVTRQIREIQRRTKGNTILS